MHRNTTCTVYSFILIVASLVVLSSGALPANASVLPISVHTEYDFSSAAMSQVEQVWLAGVSAEANTMPRALALVWSQDTTAWIPTWQLQLHSDADILPADDSTRFSPASDTYYVTLAAASPQPGITYDVWFSYDPHEGALDVAVRQTATNQTVYAATLPVGPLDGPLYAAAGTVQRGPESAVERFDTLEPKAVYDTFVPSAVRWDVVAAGDDGEFISTSVLDLSWAQHAAIRLRSDAKASGAFRVRLSGDDGPPLAQVAANIGGTLLLPLDEAHLPAGRHNVSLEYVESDRVLFSVTRTVTAGRLTVHPTPLVYDAAAGVVKGDITLTADRPLPTADIRVTAQFTEMQWNNETLRYDRVAIAEMTVLHDAIDIGAERTVIPVTLTPPATDTLWHVRFTLHTDLEVVNQLLDEEQLVGTYAAPEFAADEPFTIAILPDTQKYSYHSRNGGYPDLFIRQLHWLAENAVEQRIGLMLHVGDITDHNSVSQWEVAQQSMRLLDGVVPYVLAIGNHDMGLGGSAVDRTTLFNNYFPQAVYEGLPFFGGVFEEGHMENSFHTFTLGNENWLVIALEFLPRDSVLDWANDVASLHRDHKIIVVTHRHTDSDGGQTGSFGSWNLGGRGEMNVGTGVWGKFLRNHENMLLVFSGHIYHEAMPRGVRNGANGNRVFEMLSDFSGGPRGGNGWFVLARYFPADERFGVQVFSPVLNAVKYDDSDGFTVPFCIDTVSGFYVPVDEACAFELP